MPPKKVPISLKSSIEAVLDVVASSSEEKVVSKALVALVELTGGEGPKAIRNKSLQVRPIDPFILTVRQGLGTQAQAHGPSRKLVILYLPHIPLPSPALPPLPSPPSFLFKALGVANPAVLKADISLPVATALTSVITKFKTSEKILLKACAVIANTATTEVIGE